MPSSFIDLIMSLGPTNSYFSCQTCAYYWHLQSYKFPDQRKLGTPMPSFCTFINVHGAWIKVTSRVDS